jgi:hypothetical protein
MCAPIIMAIGAGIASAASAVGTVAAAAAGWGAATTAALTTAGISASIAGVAGAVVGVVGTAVSIVATVFSAGLSLLAGAVNYVGASGVFGATTSGVAPAAAAGETVAVAGWQGVPFIAPEAAMGPLTEIAATKTAVAAGSTFKSVIAGAKTAWEVGQVGMSAYSVFADPYDPNEGQHEFDPFFDPNMSQSEFEREYLTPGWKKNVGTEEEEEETEEAKAKITPDSQKVSKQTSVAASTKGVGVSATKYKE